MNKLISLLFESRIRCHIFHLQTNSYAAHKALGEFYEEIAELTDKLVEAYQGVYGVIIDGYDVRVSDDMIAPIDYLTNLDEMIEENRYNWVDESETALHNIIDEVCELIYSTQYKLRFLH